MITSEEIKALFFEQEFNGYKVIEQSNWESDYKDSSSCYLIFTKNKKYYRAYVYRNGSYYTDIYYEFVFDTEVVHVEKTIKVWKPKLEILK